MRINTNRIQTLFRQSQDIDKLLKTASDIMFAVCPFTIILGTLNTTEAGYKPANLIVNNYTNFQKVFTGRESVLAVWDDCYELDQVRTPLDKGGDDTNNYGIVKVKQYEDGSNGGSRFYGRLCASAVTTSFKPAPANDAMVGMTATKNVNLLFAYEKNERLFDEITNNIYKFWVIPELFEFKDSKGNNYLSTDRQWYYLETCNLIYDSNTKTPKLLQATFVSVNDVISKSGLAINQYVQISAPGDRCCFPAVANKLIVCDKEYLKYKPITHVQISLFGNVAFSNIVFMGRPCSALEQPQTEWKIEAPRLVFPHRFQASSYDEIFTNAVPETNYYLLSGCLPQIIVGWEDWRDKISQTYNAFMSKQYEGYLSIDYDTTRKTNQDQSIPQTKGLHYQYWDPRFLSESIYFPKNRFNVSGSEYFNINPNLYDSDIKFDYCGETKVLYADGKFYDTICSLAFLNLKSFFVLKQFYQIPLSLTQTTPVAISSIPIIGRYLNKLMFGLPTGFRFTSNVLTPRVAEIPTLFSCDQFELLANIFGTTAKQGIPFDVFRKDTNSDIYSICGTTSQTTSLCFNLSNILKIHPTKIDGTRPDYDKILSANYNDTIVIDSVKVGQINKEKMEAYLAQGIVDLERLEVNKGFIIDSFFFQALGQVPYRITFYSQTDDPQGNLDNKNAVWTGVYKTLSSASQNTRQWTNFMILSNPQYNFKENFYYPQNINGAPVEGEFIKNIKVDGVQELEQRELLGHNARPKLVNALVSINYLGTPTLGFVKDLGTSDSFTEEIADFKIYDEDLGLEKYTPKRATITLNPIYGAIYVNDFLPREGDTFNLSQAGNYYIYGLEEFSDWWPFWAQLPGHNNQKFKLDNPIIDEKNITLDFDKDGEVEVDLTSSSNVLNSDLPELYSDGDNAVTIYDFDTGNWGYKGCYLKAHQNFSSSWDYTQSVQPYHKYIFLNDSSSGMNIYYKEIISPKLTITKTRNNNLKCWEINIKISGINRAHADCLAAKRYNGDKNRDTIDDCFWYYNLHPEGGHHSMYYGVTSNRNPLEKGSYAINEMVSVTYKSIDKKEV